jgi:hypothetical protein
MDTRLNTDCTTCGQIHGNSFENNRCKYCVWEIIDGLNTLWYPEGTIPVIDPQLISKEIPCKAGAVPNAVQTISQSL